MGTAINVSFDFLADGEICADSILLGTSGSITSPGYPTSDYGNDLDCSVELVFANPSSTALSLEVYVNDFLLETADSVTFSTEWGDWTFSGSETPMITGQYYYCK